MLVLPRDFDNQIRFDLLKLVRSFGLTSAGSSLKYLELSEERNVLRKVSGSSFHRGWNSGVASVSSNPIFIQDVASVSGGVFPTDIPSSSLSIEPALSEFRAIASALGSVRIGWPGRRIWFRLVDPESVGGEQQKRPSNNHAGVHDDSLTVVSRRKLQKGF